MKRIYLDNNATTPVLPEIFASVQPLFNELFGNPSSIHQEGREARALFEKAREHVAAMIHAQNDEVIFTSCGTESANHALKGIAYGKNSKGNHIITTKIEHPCVLNTCQYLQTKGFDITFLPVDSYGLIEPDDVKKAIRSDTILISIMYANNETGNLLPVEEIGRIAREYGIVFHSDMVQALGKIDINMESLPVDIATFSGHKVYAPKGVGALYIRNGLEFDNLIHGGHQEQGRRAGTENIIGIVAFGKACEVIKKEMAEENKKIEFLRQKLLDGILTKIEDVRLNGHPIFRLPNTLNLSFEFVEAESLLTALDMHGIAVSSGSACASGSSEPSHVLLSMGIPAEVCQSALRFSLGRGHTEEDIDYVLSVIPDVIGRLRALSPLYKK